MSAEPTFASIGTKADDISIRLSYKIVELFSEGLYTSPNRAIEELVSNSFDAGATKVYVFISHNLDDSNASITVIDDGEGMDYEGFKRHWLIGISTKRQLVNPPKGRKQIGKFGIGKLSTYVLANRLTHISKSTNNYYSASMDYRKIGHIDQEVEPSEAINIALHKLTETQAKQAVGDWAECAKFKQIPSLFGRNSPKSWTISIMSDLKPKSDEIEPGRLDWILRTALPLRPDFEIWLNNKKLKPSRAGKNLLWSKIIGKDLTELSRPSPAGITEWNDEELAKSDEKHFGIKVPGLGRVTGYVEAYKDLLTGGKARKMGRSHGFFVYAHEKLLNEKDDHFGISPNVLRHGTFGRFRMVVHIDKLDEELRSNRETVSEGPLVEKARNLLQAVFNTVRHEIESYEKNEEPNTRLSRKVAASPASLSRRPIVDLARAVVKGEKKSRYLIVPEHISSVAQDEFVYELERRMEDAEQFVTKVRVDYDGSSRDGIAKFNTMTGVLMLNGYHPFVETFEEEFTSKKQGQPLELLSMAEVLVESQLYALGVQQDKIDELLSIRDQLLRYLANESGRRSAASVAHALSDARNNRDRLEECTCDAFVSLGFDVMRLGKNGKPDGVATAILPAGKNNMPRRYKISLEAKSTEDPSKRLAEKDVRPSTVIRHRKKWVCDHAVVVGPAFQTSKGDASALGNCVAEARETSDEGVENETITLITIDDLAKLVRLGPVKHVDLSKIRELFKGCGLPECCNQWIESLRKEHVEKPPYFKIAKTIEELQKEFEAEPVTYSALRTRLWSMSPPIKYNRDEQLMEICQGMAQMAHKYMWASVNHVGLEQSVENVMKSIDTATQDELHDLREYD